jgi:hypothetical protein
VHQGLRYHDPAFFLARLLLLFPSPNARMTSTFAHSLDALGEWRAVVSEQVLALSRFLRDQELVNEPVQQALDTVHRRLDADRLVVAFVGEFSRGKSELINALFFGDAGQRVLPATPGRTTMCPVELGFDPGQPPALALLPVATRLTGLSLAEMREQPQAWTVIPIDPAHPADLPDALQAVCRTQQVSRDDARRLGFWDDQQPDDNPPVDAQGQVEVPMWRHAVINYPHPLLRQGLVVLDTPGLNAIGAEPELTLGLLPGVHATVFILGADTGVTRSDLTIWRDHLGGSSLTRWVVLNKIDGLRDPLATPAEVAVQIERQRQNAASMLGVDVGRVFPVSARQGLAARMAGDARALADSRIKQLERALVAELLPARAELLQQSVARAVNEAMGGAMRQLAGQRRQVTEQLLELRALRGKSDDKRQLMLTRLDRETREFEHCVTHLQALRSVHARLLHQALTPLSNESLRAEVKALQAALGSTLIKFGARKAFAALTARLRAHLDGAGHRSAEIRELLSGSFNTLNADFGFALAVSSGPDLAPQLNELALIERNYLQYLGLGQALRLSQPRFMEQFRRMLLSKLRVVFEGASGELERWAKTHSALVDGQLRERRRNFRHRRDSLERVMSAATDLEQRLRELDAQERQLQAVQMRCKVLGEAVLQGLALGAEALADEGPSSSPVSSFGHKLT